ARLALDATFDDDAAEPEDALGRRFARDDLGRAEEIEQVLVEGSQRERRGENHAAEHEPDEQHASVSRRHCTCLTVGCRRGRASSAVLARRWSGRIRARRAAQMLSRTTTSV